MKNAAREIIAIVLAGGASSRMGPMKQLMRDENGVTLVERAVQCATDAGATGVIVVTGSRGSVVSDLFRMTPIFTTHNDDWQEGMGTSVASGIRKAVDIAPSAAAVLIMTCDMPTVTAAHLKELMQRFLAGAPRVASEYGDTRGNPAVFGRADWKDLSRLSGDRGAKELLQREGTQTVALPGGTLDLDTAEDVVRWRNSLRDFTGDSTSR